MSLAVCGNQLSFCIEYGELSNSRGIQFISNGGAGVKRIGIGRQQSSEFRNVGQLAISFIDLLAWILQQMNLVALFMDNYLVKEES